MNKEVKMRLEWVKLYEAIGNAGIVCLRCGITRPTLRKWFKRYKESGIDGLNELSRRPHKIYHKITKEDEHRILDLRINRNLGHRSIASEMKRLFETSFSTATLHKVLKKNNRQYLKLRRYYRKRQTRYNRPIPGDRIQMDVCKIAPGIYQYTAINDCSRFKVLGLFSRRTATNTLKFLETVMEQMPFAIQRIQTDRGKDFSTIIATQIPVASWHGLIGESTAADAILDRVVFSSHRIELEGESFRRKKQLSH